jgi:hypothetical protein
MEQPSHENSDSGDQFTLFPKLPAELRLKILDMALPGPRVITILPASGCPTPGYQFGKCDQAPAHLQVNVEARSTALKTYYLAFDWHTLSHKPKYFQFERDTLRLDYWERCSRGLSQEPWVVSKPFKDVQNISMRIVGLRVVGKEYIGKILRLFPSLKRLVVEDEFGGFSPSQLLLSPYWNEVDFMRNFREATEEIWTSYTLSRCSLRESQEGYQATVTVVSFVLTVENDSPLN